MLNKKIIFLIIFFSSALVLTIVGTIIFFNVFKLKKIEIEKNFTVDNNKIINYLGIDFNHFIFFYNINDIEEKIENLPNIRDFSVQKKLPDTLKISIYRIMPIAKTVDQNNLILFLDQSGKVLKDFSTDMKIPLIICDDRENLEKNINIREVIEILTELKKSNNKVYEQVEKIEIKEKNRLLCSYFVNYYTINQNLYLKNFINVDLLREGYLASLFIKENNYYPDKIIYNSLGFVF
ncbi:MAG TPA: FtsQ-type POTRA domain-containing protein [Spirochaetota bacterium]|nr:FtsQ-type POTRA domain-containing protein [Spirochaetota bacterium]